MGAAGTGVRAICARRLRGVSPAQQSVGSSGSLLLGLNCRGGFVREAVGAIVRGGGLRDWRTHPGAAEPAKPSGAPRFGGGASLRIHAVEYLGS